VNVQDFNFNPNPVTIHVGDTIHWVWVNGMHSTTSVAGSIETWDSGVRMAPFTLDHTFTHAGTFNYFCTIHGDGKGFRSRNLISAPEPSPRSCPVRSRGR
jgi:plastocyanin